MTRQVKAKIKGCFKGSAIVTLNQDGSIDEVIEVIDFEDVDDCEVITELYNIG